MESDDERVGISTTEEIKEAIRRLKNNKSPRENGILPEILKEGGKSLEEHIINLRDMGKRRNA